MHMKLKKLLENYDSVPIQLCFVNGERKAGLYMKNPVANENNTIYQLIALMTILFKIYDEINYYFK